VLGLSVNAVSLCSIVTRESVESTSLFAFSTVFEDLRQECVELRLGVP